MRTPSVKPTPWIATIVIAAGGCTAAGDRPAPSATAPVAATSAATHHGFKTMEPSANYPLATCVVSGEDLGAMGDRIAYSYDGTEVQLCCAGCVGKFKDNPASYLAKIPAAKE